jgi:hypothetical protein
MTGAPMLEHMKALGLPITRKTWLAAGNSSRRESSRGAYGFRCRRLIFVAAAVKKSAVTLSS